MSIATMVGLGIERQREKTVPQAEAASGKASASKKTVESAMEKIAAFIPSEVIGIYVAGFGILSPQSDAEKWWIFGICLVLIPVFMLLNYWDHRKNITGGELARLKSPRTGVILLAFAIVAFVAWVAALPGTPFLSFSARATAIGGWSVVILSLIMYRVAHRLDIVPKKR